MKTTFLFPGQGSQYAGMLQEFNSADPIVAEVYSAVQNHTGLNPQGVDSDDQLKSTINVQLCLLISGVISAKLLLRSNINPDFLAGHSVGVFSAAVISNVISFEDALDLVSIRAKMMEEAYPFGYGMAAIVGFSEKHLKELLTLNDLDKKLFIANNNAADQQVIAGSLDAINFFIPILQRGGARKVQLLNVSVPSHCELLNYVSFALKNRFETIKIDQPKYPCISNHTGRLLRTEYAIREDLFKSISETVRWYEGTTLLYELGSRFFIEMSPSGVLTKIARTTFPNAYVYAFENQNIETLRWLYDSY
ncbi:ACP S-malonyltransferase [Chryseobacterium sp. JAH]|uniref:ACP S-malonyltransferase n=1 Tax=Chryseobacterium sp. JAH TaxID=1742858 RepID=UPI000741247F|nr:malonate decarboxylase subunit epsilon [Chryseobacterium sp. JAH]KUJ50016.1 hypothetical protein AR685_16640 [Chryseobacterium sp. JAH]